MSVTVSARLYCRDGQHARTDGVESARADEPGRLSCGGPPGGPRSAHSRCFLDPGVKHASQYTRPRELSEKQRRRVRETDRDGKDGTYERREEVEEGDDREDKEVHLCPQLCHRAGVRGVRAGDGAALRVRSIVVGERTLLKHGGRLLCFSHGRGAGRVDRVTGREEGGSARLLRPRRSGRREQRGGGDAREMRRAARSASCFT